MIELLQIIQMEDFTDERPSIVRLGTKCESSYIMTYDLPSLKLHFLPEKLNFFLSFLFHLLYCLSLFQKKKTVLLLDSLISHDLNEASEKDQISLFSRSGLMKKDVVDRYKSLSGPKGGKDGKGFGAAQKDKKLAQQELLITSYAMSAIYK